MNACNRLGGIVFLPIFSLLKMMNFDMPAYAISCTLDIKYYSCKCIYRPTMDSRHIIASTAKKESDFILTLASNNHEIENSYINNYFLYTRILQYLNYDIAQDVYLRLPGRLDSVAAITASYPRQYGSTGRSSVLLVFPVPNKELRHGCYITFRGDKLDLGTRRFFFTAQDIKAAHKGQLVTK